MIARGQPHPGCTCDSKKWEGRHCQYAEGTAPLQELVHTSSFANQDADNLSSGVVFLIVACVLGGLAGGIYYFVRKRSSEVEKNTKMVEYDHPDADLPSSSMGNKQGTEIESLDDDGHVIPAQDVEII